MAISLEEHTLFIQLVGPVPPPEYRICKQPQDDGTLGCGGGTAELCQGHGKPGIVARYYQKPVRHSSLVHIIAKHFSAPRIAHKNFPFTGLVQHCQQRSGSTEPIQV